MKLRDYQQPHAEALLNSLRTHGVAKDGSDCGTGKTPVGAWVAKQYNAPVIVVPPKILIPQWRQWMLEAGVKDFHIINYESLRAGNRELVDRIEVKGSERDYYFWNLEPGTLIIWDEDHLLGGIDTQNSKLCRAATVQGYPQLFLGATSFTGPDKMQALGFALGLHKVHDFESWCLQNGCRRNQFRKLVFTGNRAVLDSLHEHIYGGENPRGSRIRIADLGDAFPSNSVQCELYKVDNPEHINHCYQTLVDELEDLDFKEEEDYDSELVLRLRARQRAELYKIPLLAELTNEHRRQGYSVVVFLSFRDSVEALCRQLRQPVSRITGVNGPVEAREREEAMRDFLANRTRVAVCVDSAGGVGIDLDDKTGEAPRVTLVNPSDNSTVFKQVLGRTVRSSTKSAVIQKVVCAEGTMEEVIYTNLKKKLDHISLINDADLDPTLPFLEKKA